jgi:hypothetical protein
MVVALVKRRARARAGGRYWRADRFAERYSVPILVTATRLHASE